MEKRGQFTILVVFAIVIVAAVAIALMLNNSFDERISSESAEKALSEFVESNLVRDYVESCLASVGETAMQTALQQGGVIWQQQNGMVEMTSNNHVETADGNVSIVISPVSEARCPALRVNFSLPWEYPYARSNVPPPAPDSSVPIEELEKQSTYAEICAYYNDAGFGGVATLKTLCTVDGPNFKGDTDRAAVYNTCGTSYDYRMNQPVQYQLKNYTQVEMSRCTDFSDMQQVGGFEVEVLEEPDIDFVFGKEDVTIRAEYPVKVSAEGKPPVTTTLNFQHRSDVRFKKLYDTYRTAVDRDTKNVSFNVSLLGGDGISVFFENIPGMPYKYLKAVDSQSAISGEQLEIKGIVRNRAPVLDRVGAADHVLAKTVTSPPLRVKVAPNAIDPDDIDELVYSYGPSLSGLTSPPFGPWGLPPEADATAHDMISRLFPLSPGTTATETLFVRVTDPYGANDYQKFTLKVTRPGGT